MNNVASLWKLIEKGRNGENIGTSTGLPKLDKIIGGIQQSRLENPRDRGALVGCRLWGHTESDTTEAT